MIRFGKSLADAERELEAILGMLKLRRGKMTHAKWTEKVKKTPFQTGVLREIFKITEFPSTTTRRDLALLLSIPQRSIQVWFQNTRQAKRKRHALLQCAHPKSSEVDSEDISPIRLMRILSNVRPRMRW